MPLVNAYHHFNAFYHELLSKVSLTCGKEAKSVELNRRDFIKLSGVGTGGFLLYSLLKPEAVLALPKELPQPRTQPASRSPCGPDSDLTLNDSPVPLSIWV